MAGACPARQILALLGYLDKDLLRPDDGLDLLDKGPKARRLLLIESTPLLARLECSRECP